MGEGKECSLASVYSSMANLHLLVVMLMVLAMTSADRLNESSSMSLTIEEEKADDIDGGFSSLDGMLQWAIGHSDPAKLEESAKDVQQLPQDEIKKRQSELKELIQNLHMPSDAELMKIAINDLSNSSLSLEDRHRALQELLVLVEPIHNANDLSKIGGLAVVIQELNHVDPDTRTLAAWILGKSSQNNPEVLELGALSRLMKMVKSDGVEEANKGLYAVSALIRNNLVGQELFFAEAGVQLLQDILSNSTTDIRLQKKAVFLVGDLAVAADLEVEKHGSFFRNGILLKSVVDLTSSSDLDLKEKALLAIKSVLQLKGKTSEAAAGVLNDVCAFDASLERMRQQLRELLTTYTDDDEFQRDYAIDLEALLNEVQLIFHTKLPNSSS
ncbi:hypothetical protein G4B88_006071 [Cannabis sativa]|uniref:Nucleotide exchange factor Fes1 domain-containing protein n=1 Tax=Cannabis sativa TaxID=3483 RepID=A0A7J6IBX1_CANSA|nr:hypothetical protein G4B88_006071 [Cannabis sativa]